MKLPFVSLKIVCLMVLLLMSGLLPAYANLTNEGNEAIDVQVTRKSGPSQRLTIFPGQSIGTPEGAQKIRVLSRTARGDEFVKLRIDQEAGEPKYLNKAGQFFVFGEEAEEKETALTLPRVENAGNIAVKLILTKQDGVVTAIDILPGQIKTLKDHIVRMALASRLAPPRGDEIIRVNVTMPTGEAKVLYGIGGTIRFDEKPEEEPKLEIPAALEPGQAATAQTTSQNPQQNNSSSETA